MGGQTHATQGLNRACWGDTNMKPSQPPSAPGGSNSPPPSGSDAAPDSDLFARVEAELAANRPEQGLALLQAAIEGRADPAWAHILMGDCHAALKKREAALACYDRGIALRPDQAPVHARRARVLLKLKRYPQALAAAMRATNLDPGSIDGWAVLGRILGKLGQHPAAIGAYRTALKIDPTHPFLKGRLLQQMVLASDWTDIDALIADIEEDLAAGRSSARPFVWQAVATSARSLQLCAEQFAQPPGPAAAAPAAARPQNERIRIGYVSAELRDHSISYLRVGMFEHHDRDRFEIVAFDNGWDDGGAMRARINKAIERIIPIRDLSDDEAAATIAREGIDVLVDLNGFNGDNRNGVFARSPAPVQATFPGYPGTVGALYMDYIVSDAIVLPAAHEPFYSERPARLPDSYQANDRAKIISDRRFTRAELGLPSDGFVFCCFNSSYKIMPAMLDVWARILRAVPGSVLWLLASNATVIANLRKEARAWGVDPARLVFADRLPLGEHLARHRCAGLFLDTLPCNAHTTASDALWSGLPVLTCLGETFSGRVAASVLHAIRMPEMVTATLADYERKAIELATDPDTLARTRDRLNRNRLTTPLFDTARHTRHIEAAFAAMHARRVAGLPPAPINIPSD